MGRGGSGVRKASETSIEISFTYRGVRCRPRVKLKPTAPNLRKAESFRREVIDSINAGNFDYATTFPNCPKRFMFASHQGQVTTVESYLTEWFDRLKPGLKTSTVKGYEKIIYNKLIPEFGSQALSDLSRIQIARWADSLDVTGKTLNNILSPLKQALAHALNYEIIADNPMAGWDYKKPERKVKANDVDPFSRQEQIAILNQLQGQARNLIQFAFWTGLRTSEYVALDWNDIDFHKGVAIISKAKTQASNKAESTKTDAGNREVKLLPDALSALLDQKKHTYLSGKEVFQNPRTLERWAGDAPVRKTLWRHALRKAEVRYRRPYQTRHTFASMLLSAGESPMWVAQQMGHKDWTMIAKVYGRWIPEANPNAGDKAVEMFGLENNSN